MFFLLHASLVFATPDPPLARANERIRTRRYARVVGDGPMWPSRRRSAGPIEAWTWPDLMIEHYHRTSGRRRVETHRFNASGQLLSSVYFDKSGKVERVQIGDRVFSAEGWSLHPIGGFSISLPPTDTLSVQLGDGQFTVRVAPFSTDPSSAAFTEGLGAWCGCLLLDRNAVWLDGQRATRFLLDFPHPVSPERAELWVWSTSTDTLFATYRGPNSLVPGRALISTVRRKP